MNSCREETKAGYHHIIPCPDCGEEMICFCGRCKGCGKQRGGAVDDKRSETTNKEGDNHAEG